MTAYTCSRCRKGYHSLGMLHTHFARIVGCDNAFRWEKPELSIHARCFVCEWEITAPVKEARVAIREHFNAHPSQTIAGKHVCRQRVMCQCGYVGTECSTRSDVDMSLGYHRSAHRTAS